MPGPELFDLVDDLRKTRTTLDQKVEQSYTSLRETSKVISELEQSLEDRASQLDELRQEHERLSALAEVEEDKAAALITQLERSLDRQSKRERWVGLALNLLAGLIIFVIGIFLSPLVRGWIGF